MKKNKKSWFKGLVVAGVFTISVLNLSVDVQHDANGDVDLATLSISSQHVSAEESLDGGGGFNCAMVSTDTCTYVAEFHINCMCWGLMRVPGLKIS